MDTVGTGSASQFRLYERQLGWKPPCPQSRTPTFDKRNTVYLPQARWWHRRDLPRAER